MTDLILIVLSQLVVYGIMHLILRWSHPERSCPKARAYRDPNWTGVTNITHPY